MFRLDNKRAFVTGAASGIGAAVARTLGDAGAAVIVADVNREGGERVAEELRAKRASAEFVLLDVTEFAACQRAADQVLSKHDAIDIVVNDAGIGHVGTTLQTTADDLDRLYAVNVRGVFNVSKAFLPSMLRRRTGNIVNVASIGGVVGIRDRIAYCATKFAVVGITKSMALDHAADGVRVNCICPGRVETPFVSARLKEYPDPEKAYREMAGTQALGRMARPDEIAHAALYLASNESAFVTGTAFLIDGGWSAGK